jgi:hypothetical protein
MLPRPGVAWHLAARPEVPPSCVGPGAGHAGRPPCHLTETVPDTLEYLPMSSVTLRFTV